MKTKDLCDNSNSYSTTRWGFVTCIKVSVAIVFIAVVAFVICHLVGKPLDNSFLGSVGVLVGIIMGVSTTGKALQGFETKKEKEENTQEEILTDGK